MSDKQKTFTITVEGSYTLTVDEIWPDGDAPENPTREDVAAAMKKSCHSTYQLMRDWNLDDGMCVDVDGLPVDL